MQLLKKLKEKAQEIKTSTYLLYRSLGDPRVPLYVKVFAFLIVAYIVSPIDIIPDFIPVLGLLDEIILVPIMLSYVVKMIPPDLKHEYEDNGTIEIEDKRLALVGSAIILLVWLLLAILCMYYLEII